MDLVIMVAILATREIGYFRVERSECEQIVAMVDEGREMLADVGEGIEIRIERAACREVGDLGPVS